MITRISTRAVCGGMLAAGLLLSGCSTTAESRADIRTDSHSALNDLYQKIPAAKGVADNAKAILVFPSVTQAGLGVGGQYGRGAMYQDGNVTGYYNVTGGSIGLQIGAQTFSEAYFFTSQKALDTFKKAHGFEVGVGLDVAVADKGTSGHISSETLQKPVVAFVWGQQGLMAGAKVEGQKITKLGEKNENKG